MKLSVVVPIFNHSDNIEKFVKNVREHSQKVSDELEIILTTNQEFEYVEKLHSLFENTLSIIAVNQNNDYQQVIMAGIDRASGDATVLMTPDYDPSLIEDMVGEWNKGKDVVCLRRKHGRIGKFIAKIRLRIYNLFLFMFGDIFSIGILKDAQLLDKKIVDKMKTEQDLAHRIRTMYAPLDYKTTVVEIEHPIERFETKGTPKLDFWLGSIGAIITLLALFTAYSLAGALSAPIWFWTTITIFALIFEFIFIALLVNATARVKIGILHNVDSNGRIYNAVQEYCAVQPNTVEINLAKNNKTTSKNIESVAKKTTKSTKPKSAPAKSSKKTDTENIAEITKPKTKSIAKNEKTNEKAKQTPNKELSIDENVKPSIDESTKTNANSDANLSLKSRVKENVKTSKNESTKIGKTKIKKENLKKNTEKTIKPSTKVNLNADESTKISKKTGTKVSKNKIEKENEKTPKKLVKEEKGKTDTKIKTTATQTTTKVATKTATKVATKTTKKASQNKQ